MSCDVFGDLQEWGRVLDQAQQMQMARVAGRPSMAGSFSVRTAKRHGATTGGQRVSPTRLLAVSE